MSDLADAISDGNVLQTPDLTIYERFDDMGLPEPILRGIYAYGFERPSDIQTKAIVPIKDGRDVIAQARSGTGKTATFCIGSLSKVNPEVKKTQVLVLVHVRELALQIKTVATSLSDYMGISCYCPQQPPAPPQPSLLLRATATTPQRIRPRPPPLDRRHHITCHPTSGHF